MISVCMATHNGEKYIEEQLSSILVQLSNEDEIVISDDGSIDNTLNKILSFNDKRIHIYKLHHTRGSMPKHYYVTKNFENALKNAKGDIIFMADQDDVWMPDKVKLCLEALKDSDLVVSNLECVDLNLKPLNKTIYSDKFRFHNFLLLKGKYYGCALAFKQSILTYALPFPEKLLLHDYWIGIMAEIFAKVKYIEKPLIKYRIHQNNVSVGHHKNSLSYKLNYRFYIIFNVLLRIIKYKLL